MILGRYVIRDIELCRHNQEFESRKLRSYLPLSHLSAADLLKDKDGRGRMDERLARIADREDDYVRLRLKPGQIEAWEDGMRTSGDRGSYEWWYFDAHLEDGSSMVITFYTKPMLSPKGP